jgi:hypothetical protein
MSTYTIYLTATGEIIGTLQCAPEHLAANLREGIAAIDGLHDGLRYRVQDGQAVPWESPRLAEMQHAARLRAIDRRIAALEQQQARALRELTLDPQHAAARRRLDEIDRAIAALRADRPGGHEHIRAP